MTTDPPTVVHATFRSKKAVVAAVEGLSERSVPSDSIEVVVLDEEGHRLRTVPVDAEAGVVPGLVTGGLVGGLIGALAAAVAVAVYGSEGELGTALLTWVGRGAAVGAGGGAPLGGIVALGRWGGRSSLSAEEVRRGGTRVSVRGEALADVALEVLHAAGGVVDR